MKRILALLLCIFAAAALVSCGGGEEQCGCVAGVFGIESPKVGVADDVDVVDEYG